MNLNEFLRQLTRQKVEKLRTIASILEAEQSKLIKGGVSKKLKKEELLRTISRKIAQTPMDWMKSRLGEATGFLEHGKRGLRGNFMTKKDIEEEVGYFLEGILHGCLTVERGRKFEWLLGQVLDKIWPEIEDREDEIQSIIFADGSSLFPIYEHYIPIDSFPVPHEQQRKKWIIFFPDTLCDESEEAIKYVIAHEFAHFKLGHEFGAEKEKHQEGEKAAKDLAAKWGFPEPKDRLEKSKERNRESNQELSQRT